MRTLLIWGLLTLALISPSIADDCFNFDKVAAYEHESLGLEVKQVPDPALSLFLKNLSGAISVDVTAATRAFTVDQLDGTTAIGLEISACLLPYKLEVKTTALPELLGLNA